VARVWHIRERVEREAAALFARLERLLAASGAGRDLVAMARQAALDERAHAARCRALVLRFAPDPAPPAPAGSVTLGPPQADVARRALYASVAMCCVTETLSTALLLEMRARARDPVVADTVQHILRDEVRHSRLGWAHLAVEARRQEVVWLGPHLPGMLQDAVQGDLPPPEEGAADLSSHGILPRARVEELVVQTAEQVIFSGLESHGVDTAAARHWLARQQSGRSAIAAPQVAAAR
jgi:hypothetical protein